MAYRKLFGGAKLGRLFALNEEKKQTKKTHFVPSKQPINNPDMVTLHRNQGMEVIHRNLRMADTHRNPVWLWPTLNNKHCKAPPTVPLTHDIILLPSHPIPLSFPTLSPPPPFFFRSRGQRTSGKEWDIIIQSLQSFPMHAFHCPFPLFLPPSFFFPLWSTLLEMTTVGLWTRRTGVSMEHRMVDPWRRLFLLLIMVVVQELRLPQMRSKRMQWMLRMEGLMDERLVLL